MASGRDVRVCVFGDSYVAGTGDPRYHGWVGVLAARSASLVAGLTVYNLGVRRDTSADVRSRWQAEAAARLPAGVDGRVVVSFGVNDCAREKGRLRVSPEQAAANLAAILTACRVRVFVVGPPPVADDQRNDRVAGLDRAFADVCADHDVPYAAVFAALSESATWRGELAAGDGSHPGAAGYAELAALLWNTGWPAWVAAQ